jgi:hypothetical protein
MIASASRAGCVFGHISKQGNRLLRFLFIEAAHTALRDGLLAAFLVVSPEFKNFL